MTSKAALVKYLLDGKVINIKNGFHLLSITNVPREIGRSIERAFDVEVTRVDREGVSKYKQPCVWVDYHLEKNERNKEGIKKMREYLAENMDEYRPKEKIQEHKTSETSRRLIQTNLF